MDEFPSANSSSALDDSNAPLEDRVVSKNWRTRSNAYDELGKEFRMAEDAKEPIFRQYGTVLLFLLFVSPPPPPPVPLRARTRERNRHTNTQTNAQS